MTNPYESPRSDARTQRDACCSFCERSYRDVGPLVEGPDSAYLCGACCDDVLASYAAKTEQAHAAGEWCSFCRKESVVTGWLTTANSGVQICAECADLARNMIDHEILRRAGKGKR